MVKGLAELNRRWGAVPAKVREAVNADLEKIAVSIVADMRRVKPLPEIEIDWTWGKPPGGAIALGSVAGEDGAKQRITIYARGAQGSGFSAAWFEFGTADRFHKSGKYVGRITASPFFFPVWRARRRSVKSRVSRAITRAIKQA